MSRVANPGRCVIIGCGYAGGRVLAALGADNAVGFRRSGAMQFGDSPVRRLDLDDDRATRLTFPDAYTLLYTVPPRSDGQTDERLPRLLSMLQPLPVRLVYLSTSGVYGDCGGRLVDESTPPDPQSARAIRRLDAERQLREWAERRDVSPVVLRVPGIYGPGRLPIDAIREGTPVVSEADAHPGNRIHVDDLASCCIAALSVDRPAGIYNVSDGDHRSSSWFTLTVARLAGLPAPPEVSRKVAVTTFSAMRLSFLAESRRLDNRKMLAVLGVEPRYANAEMGIRASLAADKMLKRETLPEHRP